MNGNKLSDNLVNRLIGGPNNNYGAQSEESTLRPKTPSIRRGTNLLRAFLLQKPVIVQTLSVTRCQSVSLT